MPYGRYDDDGQWRDDEGRRRRDIGRYWAEDRDDRSSEYQGQSGGWPSGRDFGYYGQGGYQGRFGGDRSRYTGQGQSGESQRYGSGREWGREDRDFDWQQRGYSRGGRDDRGFFGREREGFFGIGDRDRWGDDDRWGGGQGERSVYRAGYGGQEDRGFFEKMGDRLREGFRRIGSGPKGFKRSDERIREDVSERIARSWINAEEVEVLVQDGEVTLTGTVQSREHKRAIEDIADDVFGVKEVHNQLRTSQPGSRMGESATTSSGVGASSSTSTPGRTGQGPGKH
jgi:hypothetical protein